MKKNITLVNYFEEMKKNAKCFDVSLIETKQVQNFKPCYILDGSGSVVGSQKQGATGLIGANWEDKKIICFNNEIYSVTETNTLINNNCKSVKLSEKLFTKTDIINKVKETTNNLYMFVFNDNTYIYYVLMTKRNFLKNFFSLSFFLVKSSGKKTIAGFCYRDTAESRTRLKKMIVDSTAELYAVSTIENFLLKIKPFVDLQSTKFKKNNYGKLMESVISGYIEDINENRVKKADCRIDGKATEIKTSLSINSKSKSNSNLFFNL